MLPRMIDMKKDAKEMMRDTMPFGMGSQSEYPYGLSICLGNDELEKLGLDNECEVGDMIHLFALAKVTSLSKNDTGDGEKTRIELQITHLGCEDENEENEEVAGEEEGDEEDKPRPVHKRLYR